MIEIETVLPTNFLNDEIRNGYLVRKKMKEVWAVELDLLKKFISVCDKYNLGYYAESGTLLGAVRHGGFIPWDDDIDIVMRRRDYIKLCKVAHMEFEFPYFFQTEETDPGSIRGHAQLRNSLTTGILQEDLKRGQSFNQGIFIDIFPMDRLPNIGEEEDFFERLKYLKKKSYDFAEKYHRQGIVTEINPYYQELENLCQRYNDDDNAVRMGTIEFTCNRSDMIRKIDDYKEYIEVEFEFLQIRIPIGYQRILTEQYKSWKEFVIGKNGHGNIFFDTSMSYKNYLELTI